MTPYEFLGVPPDADGAIIHARYRYLAKSMHPDTGGDLKSFDRLGKIHDLLMDEDRRAHYDRTGEITPSAADNQLAQILTIVSGAFDDAVSGVIKAQEDLAKVDLMQRMREALVRRTEMLEKNRIEAMGAVTKLESMLGRFVKQSDDGPNHLETVVREKLRHAGEVIKNIATEREKIGTALKFLAAYRYRSDPATLVFTEPPPYRPKVTVDFADQQTPGSLQEQLAQQLYGLRRPG